MVSKWCEMGVAQNLRAKVTQVLVFAILVHVFEPQPNGFRHHAQ